VRLSTPQWQDILDDLESISSLKSVCLNGIFCGYGGSRDFHGVKFKVRPTDDDGVENLRDRCDTKNLAELKSSMVICDRDWCSKHRLDEDERTGAELLSHSDSGSDLYSVVDTDEEDDFDAHMEELEDMVMGGMFS
jgi:hypothetical protein